MAMQDECRKAILSLMADGKARTSQMIAALTGFHPGYVRAKLTQLELEVERKPANTRWPVTWYRYRKAGE